MNGTATKIGTMSSLKSGELSHTSHRKNRTNSNIRYAQKNLQNFIELLCLSHHPFFIDWKMSFVKYCIIYCQKPSAEKSISAWRTRRRASPRYVPVAPSDGSRKKPSAKAVALLRLCYRENSDFYNKMIVVATKAIKP